MLATIYNRYTTDVVDATLAEATYGTNTRCIRATIDTETRDTASVTNTGIGGLVVTRPTTEAPASTEPWSRKHIRREVTRYSEPPDRTDRAASAYTYGEPLCDAA